MSGDSKAILVTGAAELVDLLGPNSTQWAIYSSGTSSDAIQPDSFSAFEFMGESRVGNYPLEKGAFSSYNKVRMPYSIRVRLVCDNRRMNRGDFLRRLNSMRKETSLFDVAVPDGFYQNLTLVRYDYKQTSSHGASMIVADVVFEEVRQTASANYSASQTSNSPSAASTQNIGTATSAQPTPAQMLALQRGVQ